MCSRVRRNNEVISLREPNVRIPINPYRGSQVIALTDVSEYEHHGTWYEMPAGKGIVAGYRQIKDRVCSWIVTNHESNSNPHGKQHPVLTSV